MHRKTSLVHSGSDSSLCMYLVYMPVFSLIHFSFENANCSLYLLEAPSFLTARMIETLELIYTAYIELHNILLEAYEAIKILTDARN
jgi:hypothetical protein